MPVPVHAKSGKRLDVGRKTSVVCSKKDCYEEKRGNSCGALASMLVASLFSWNVVAPGGLAPQAIAASEPAAVVSVKTGENERAPVTFEDVYEVAYDVPSLFQEGMSQGKQVPDAIDSVAKTLYNKPKLESLSELLNLTTSVEDSEEAIVVAPVVPLPMPFDGLEADSDIIPYALVLLTLIVSSYASWYYGKSTAESAVAKDIEAEERLLATLSEKANELSQKQAAIDALEAEIASLQSAIKEQKAQTERAEAELQKLLKVQEELDAKKAEAKNVWAELQKVQSSLTAEKGGSGLLRDKLTAVEAELSAANNKLDAAEAGMASAKEAQSQLAADLEAANKSLGGLKMELANLTESTAEQTKGLEAEIGKLKKELTLSGEKGETAALKLEADMKHKDAQIKELMAKVQEAQATEESVMAKLKTAENEIKQLKAAAVEGISEVEAELAGAMSKMKSLEEENSQLPKMESDMEKKVADWAALEASWKALLAEKDENTSLLEAKLTERDASKVALEQKLAELEAFWKAKLAEKDASEAALKKQLAELEAKWAAKLGASESDLQARLAERDGSMGSVEGKLKDMEAAMALAAAQAEKKDSDWAALEATWQAQLAEKQELLELGMASEAGHLKKIKALEVLLAEAQAASGTPTVTFGGVPSAALKVFDENLLIGLKAYLEFKARGVDFSSREEQTLDWNVSTAAVKAMKAAGADTEDLVREYCRLAAGLIKEGDLSQLQGDAARVIVGSMLGSGDAAAASKTAEGLAASN